MKRTSIRHGWISLSSLSLILSITIFGLDAESKSQSRRSSHDEGGYSQSTADDEIKIMHYNVENLFDTDDDPKINDAQFLPLKDPGKKECENQTGNYKKLCYNTNWTTDGLRLKLAQIRRVVEAQGARPDALVLVEVENRFVIEKLAEVLGYKEFLITEGPDERGIDIAILWNPSKLKYVSHDELPVPGIVTRPILKAHFRTRPASRGEDPGHIVIYGNHWPSQAAPPPARMSAAAVVRKEIDRDMKKVGDEYFAVVVGDMNTPEKERPNSISVLTDSRWKFHLADVHTLSDESDNPMNGIMPKASYYYDGWTRLDHMLVTQNFLSGDGLKILPETFRVIAPDFMRKERSGERVPMRYDFNSRDRDTAGFSDHFPIVVKIKL